MYLWHFYNKTFFARLSIHVKRSLPTNSDLKRPPSRALIAANGTPIKSYGTRQLQLKIQHFTFTCRFQVAEAQNIIGADFLRSQGLVPDLTNRRLVRLADLRCVSGILKDTKFIRITSLTGSSEFTQILQGRPELTTPTFALANPKHGIQHHIVTEGPPVHAQARRLHPDKLVVAKNQFKTLLDLGIARGSKSPYASPLHLAPKPDGEWRPCVECRLSKT